MTSRLKAKKKISRKLGVNLWGHANDPFIKKNYKPGEHGANLRLRDSDYKKQLQAKQKLKFYYNISEKQFRNIFKKAAGLKGDTSENFIIALESRLDAVVYNANFVPTIFAARQFINHKCVTINGKVVNIRSCILKVGDIVQIREKYHNMNMVLESFQKMERDVPPYLELNIEDKSVKFLALPEFTDVPYPTEMEPHLVTELYSR